MTNSTLHKYIDMKSKQSANMILAPTGNMGIDRAHMPQIDFKFRDKFIEFIKSKDINVRDVRVPIKSLKMVQGMYDRDKVSDMISNGIKAGAPIFVSSDGFIIDGNHRLIAMLNQNNAPQYIKVTELGMSAKELLVVIHSFPKVRYRKL